MTSSGGASGGPERGKWKKWNKEREWISRPLLGGNTGEEVREEDLSSSMMLMPGSLSSSWLWLGGECG